MINSPQDDIRPRRIWQAPWRTQTQGTSLVLAGVVMVAVIGALYLAQASRTSTAGRRLQDLESQRQQLEQQNAQLRAEIAALRSVPRLISAAQGLGYHQASASEVDYVVVRGVNPPVSDVVQVEDDTPTAGEALTAEIDDYDETLESYLSENLEEFRDGFVAFWRSTFGSEASSEEDPRAILTPTPTRVP